MTDVHALLADIWFFLLGLILALYVVLDGFDLGVGVISLFSREQRRRRLMMSSLSSVWDANETWLIIFAGAMFGAFPAAYATILHALYIPITLMLFGLIMRGVAFEFHVHSRYPGVWEWSFGAGSLVAAVCQGLILGDILGGIRVGPSGLFAGGMLDWLRPFSIATVVGVLSGYVMLGATFLIMRTEGAIQRQHYRRAALAAICSFSGAIASMVVMPHIDSPLAHKWETFPAAYGLFAIFFCAAFAFLMLLFSLYMRWEHAPFLWAIVVFLFTALDLGLTLHPYMIPTSMTVDAAAASSVTLIFMLTGIGMLIPVIMIYNGYVYMVFHGKVSEKSGYSAL